MKKTTLKTVSLNVIGYVILGITWFFVVHETDLLPFPYEDYTFIAVSAVFWYLVGRRDILDINDYEEKLRKSEEIYRTLAESAQDAIYIINREDRVEYVNSFGAGLYGLKPDDMIGRQREDLFPSDLSEQQKDKLKKVYETGRSLYAEDKIIFPKVDIWMHTLLVPMRDKAGEVNAVMGISRDITERKKAEDEIHLLQTITKAISESEDFNDAMNIVIRKFCDVTGWLYGEAWVPSHDKSYFEMDSAWYSSIKGMEEFRKKSYSFKFSMGKGIPGRVWASKKPLWVRDISKDTNFARTQLAEQFGLKSGMGIPIIAGDDVVAVLTFFVFEDRKEDEALLAIISPIAAQLGALFRRKMAEEALKESERRLRLIAENTTDVIVSYDMDRRLIYVNPAVKQLTGYSAEELKERNYIDSVHPDDKEKVKRLWDGLFEGKSFANEEIRIVCKEGQIKWSLNTWGPICDENDTQVGVHGIGHDITDHKRMEEELLLLYTLIQEISMSDDFRSALEISLKKICEATGWVMGEAWVPSANRSHLECSPAWYGGFEGLKKFRKISEGFKFLPGTGLPGRSWSSKTPIWDRDVTLDSNFPRAPYAKEAGLKGALAIPILAGDEVVAVMDFFVTEPREEDRGLVELVSTIASYLGSIFQRKQVEEELRKLYHAVEQSPASIFITDAAGNIEYINPKFIEITGYSREEVLGKKPDLLSSGTTMLSDTEWRGELLAKKKNGDLFWEYATISPVRNVQGEITNFIGIHEDITERRKLEDQLRHSQKLEAIGQLVGGIAHDFNNILTAIIGFAGMLQMSMKKDDPLMVNVEQVLEAADRGASLTRSLLVFGRKQAIFPRPVTLNEIIEKVEKLLSRLIGEGIELRIVTVDNELTVTADSLQIEQVLMNLATNARDAMQDKGTLTIETRREKIDKTFIKSHGYGEPGAYAVVSVSDTGTGMDEKTRQKVFEPFFTTKEVGKGTGLGLAIAYGIVKQHNGYITVYSEVGKGTTFKIYLPMTRPAAGDAALVETQEHEASPSSETSATGTETILVAEDDKSVRRLSKTLLETFGYTVIEAVDGEEAVQKYRENKDAINLLLLDVIMPKKNGKEAYEEIKKIAPEARVIFMSGYTADVMHAKGVIENGMVFISKPISPTVFIKKVREVLDR